MTEKSINEHTGFSHMSIKQLSNRLKGPGFSQYTQREKTKLTYAVFA